MIIGYAIVGQDNNSYIYDVNDKLLPVCKKCGFVNNFDYISPNFILNKKNYDYSYTYDNRCIVSKKFKEFCEKNNYQGLIFNLLSNEKKFFNLKIKNYIEIDEENKKYNYENYCKECGNYESITPGFPIILRIKSELPDGFFRTNLLTGSCNGKSPIFCIGLETYNKIQKEKFKGLHFIKIENKPKPSP